MRPARTINYTALGWLAVAFLAAIALILVVPLAWHLTVALWTSGAAWWLAVVAGVLVTGGSISAAVHRSKENIDLRGRVYELEADVRDLTAALAEATATLADARVVIPLRSVESDALTDLERARLLADFRTGIGSREVPLHRPDPEDIPPESRRVVPMQRTDSWLEQVMDEQARDWPEGGGA